MPSLFSKLGLGQRPRWLALSTPLVVSLLIHGALVSVLGAVAFNVARLSDDPGTGETDVYISLRPRPTPTDPATPLPPRNAPSPPALPKTESIDNAGAGAGPSVPVPGPTNDDASLAPPAPTAPLPPDRSVSESLSAAPIGVTFAGLKAEKARSVVYVVDCSGPMVSTLPQVLAELRRSIDLLEPTQKFNVILFGDDGQSGGPYAQFDARLLDASPRNLGRLSEWLKAASPRGRSNPLDGLRAALALKPQAVFLLSRSIERSAGNAWGAGTKATLAELESLNPRGRDGARRTVIKTIQFLEDDPTGTMQLIAGGHGGGGGSRGSGAYRVLRREELR
ncbi:MAG: hypothetical protein ACT4PL_08005 [Phycisphaerales bacterium]